MDFFTNIVDTYKSSRMPDVLDQLWYENILSDNKPHLAHVITCIATKIFFELLSYFEDAVLINFGMSQLVLLAPFSIHYIKTNLCDNYDTAEKDRLNYIYHGMLIATMPIPLRSKDFAIFITYCVVMCKLFCPGKRNRDEVN